MTAQRDLISKRTRSEFREICVGSVVREICRTFEDEGFGLDKTVEPTDPVWRDGTRRGYFSLYADRIDWTDPLEVGRAVRVFETMLGWIGTNEFGVGAHKRVVSLLKSDGYQVTEDGRIVALRSASLARDLPLEVLADASALDDHIERIERAATDDPALAISQAKALVEATAKLVLIELGETFDERADVPELVTGAQKALALHPGLVAPTTKGADYIRKILGALSTIAITLAELRNLYGPDHGRATTAPLSARHAHLAIGAATTYCRMLLETLDARRSKSAFGAAS